MKKKHKLILLVVGLLVVALAADVEAGGSRHRTGAARARKHHHARGSLGKVSTSGGFADGGGDNAGASTDSDSVENVANGTTGTEPNIAEKDCPVPWWSIMLQVLGGIFICCCVTCIPLTVFGARKIQSQQNQQAYFKIFGAMPETDGDWDPYKVLGVEKTATPHEIKNAYYKKALRCHSDKIQPNDPEKEVKEKEFLNINRANECLQNADMRECFDQLGWYPKGYDTIIFI
eukprot:276160_1